MWPCARVATRHAYFTPRWRVWNGVGNQVRVGYANICGVRPPSQVKSPFTPWHAADRTAVRMKCRGARSRRTPMPAASRASPLPGPPLRYDQPKNLRLWISEGLYQDLIFKGWLAFP